MPGMPPLNLNLAQTAQSGSDLSTGGFTFGSPSFGGGVGGTLGSFTNNTNAVIVVGMVIVGLVLIFGGRRSRKNRRR